jgi:hypothetical protein
MTKIPVHLPGCSALACGGWVRCRCCGRRFGWCRGSDVDRGTCPECWATPDDVKPPFRFRPRGRHVFRLPNGRITARSAT